MNSIILYFILPIFSFVLVLILIHPLRKLAIKVSLVDKPSERKTHTKHVPLIGGILIVISSGIALMVSSEFWDNIKDYYILVIGSAILLIIGIIDDKMDIRAIPKLIIQIALAYFVFDSGTQIDSLYGILGIHELPMTAQYIITLSVIVGVINAFNLMDGIDGLAAGLAIVGLSVYTYIAFLNGNIFLVLLFISLAGALVGFLKYNLLNKNKIFMGDAGSLVLGYILVVSGIILIQSAKNSSNITITLATVIGVLALPVADSLRVYLKRIKLGYSPFRADKIHFHHLVLLFRIKHKTASFIIIFFSVSLIIISIFFGSFFSITITILSILILFVLISTLLEVNREISIWKSNIQKLEEL